MSTILFEDGLWIHSRGNGSNSGIYEDIHGKKPIDPIVKMKIDFTPNEAVFLEFTVIKKDYYWNGGRWHWKPKKLVYRRPIRVLNALFTCDIETKNFLVKNSKKF